MAQDRYLGRQLTDRVPVDVLEGLFGTGESQYCPSILNGDSRRCCPSGLSANLGAGDAVRAVRPRAPVADG
jgi:hypothetical protein